MSHSEQNICYIFRREIASAYLSPVCVFPRDLPEIELAQMPLDNASTDAACYDDPVKSKIVRNIMYYRISLYV